MSLRLPLRALTLAFLAAFFVVSCWDDESSPTAPQVPPVDTTHRDTTRGDTGKADTAKKDTTGKDTAKVDTSSKVVGPAGSDSLAPGQKSKDLQLGGVVGSGKSATWVRFQGTSGHTYTLTALPRGQATIQVFLVLGSDTLAQVATPLVGDSVVFPCLRAGTHVAKLIGPAGTKLTLKVGENNLIPMYFEGADSWEPDNDTAHALTWNLNSDASQRRTTHFAGAVDTDMIRLVLDSGTTLTVTANGTYSLPDLGRPSASLVAVDGSELAWSEKPKGTWTHASFQARTAYLRLEGSTSTNPYTVSAKATPGLPSGALLQDSLEPDGALGQGPVITTDSTPIQRNLHGYVMSEDVDRFRLSADSGTVYHITVQGNTKPQLEVTTVGGIRQAIHDSSAVSIDARTWSFLCQKSGEYSLAVRAPDAVVYRIVCVARKAKPAWATQPDSFELDDTRDRAVDLGSGPRRITRQLVQNDVDWHSVKVEAGQTWVVFLEFKTGSAIPEIYDADSVRLEGFPAGFGDKVFSRRFGKAGTYYLRLVGHNERWGTPSEYTLVSQVGTSTGDVGEPDDSVNQAVEVSVDGQWIGRTSRLGDQDWMKVHVPAGNQLRLWLEAPVPGSVISVSLEMRDPKDPLVNWGPYAQVAPNMPRDSAQLSCPRDTTVLLQVKGVSGETLLDAPYRIRMSLFPIHQDPLEPDDNPIPTIPADSTWIVRELHEGDVDRMSVPVKANQACTFRVEGVDDKDWTADKYVEVDLFGVDSKRIAWLNVSEPRSIFNRQDGNFTLKVAAPSGFTGSYPYRVSAHCRAVPDSMEPDEGKSKAVDLPYDSLVRLRHVIDGDQDWMRLPPAPGKVRYLQFASDTRSGYFGWNLFREDSSVVSMRIQSMAQTGIIPGAGAYQILVGDLSDTNTYYLGARMGSTKDEARYGVRAWTISDPDPFEGQDAPATAPLLTPSSITRWISKGDTDFFRLHLEPGQAVRPRSTGNVAWSLLSKTGAWADRDLLRGVLLQSDTAVDYLVKVLPTKDSAVFQPYSMALDAMPFDTSVRHVRRATAVPVASPDGILRSALTSYADTMWFRVHMDSGRSVRFAAHSQGRIVLRSQDSVRYLDSLGSMSLFYMSTKDTCFYVGFPPRTDSLQLRPVSVVVSNDFRDAYEPDDSPATAVAIDSGVWQERILMVGDTDFIQMPAGPDSTRWSVDIQFSEITIGTELVRADGRTTGNNSFLSPGQSWSVTPKGTGPFYLRFVGMNYGGDLPWIGGTTYRLRVFRK
ncbi:MAG TPA: hypothetical protein PKO15_14230 [Fibrobacteria bacterium]|nr:hypothetical protein [Fibrobacteria bacterium]HOX50929.1 hypothetical protein [Fibrobacteria bacterium]